MVGKNTQQANDPTGLAMASVRDLLALEDEAFVRSAYLTLLGREPDQEGFTHYVTLTRAGEDKSRIVAILASSDEGMLCRGKLLGLDALMHQYPLIPAPWPQRALLRLTRLLGRSSLEPTERTLRALENRLYRLSLQLEDQSTALATLNHNLAQLSISVDGPRRPRGMTTNAIGSIDDAPLRQVPPRVEQVFRSIKQGLARGASGI